MSFTSWKKAAKPSRIAWSRLDSDRAETEPKVFTRIHMHFIVKGRGLAEAKVKRAIDLSIEKYCSATAMLSKTATVTHDYEVDRHAGPFSPV